MNTKNQKKTSGCLKKIILFTIKNKTCKQLTNNIYNVEVIKDTHRYAALNNTPYCKHENNIHQSKTTSYGECVDLKTNNTSVIKKILFVLSSILLCFAISFPTFATTNEDPQTIIVRNKQIHRLYVDEPHTISIHKPKNNKYKLLGGISIGANYIYSPIVQFKDGGITTNLISERNTHTIMPLSFELETPSHNKISFSVGGSYVINPFWNSKSVSNTGVMIFNAKTKYSLYGKINYNFSQKFSGYILGGVTNFDMFIYNDITNDLFAKTKTTVPSVGLGFTLETAPRCRMFADFIYSYIQDSNIRYTGSNPRLLAISKREYHSFQTKIGFVFNMLP